MNRKLVGGPSRKGFGETLQKETHVVLNDKKEDETDGETDGGASDWRSTFDASETIETASVATFETCSEPDDDFNNEEIGLGGDETSRRRSSNCGDACGIDSFSKVCLDCFPLRTNYLRRQIPAKKKPK